MKTLPAGLAEHLAGEVTTPLCRCWRLTRRDGAVLGFTDHDRDISVRRRNLRSGDRVCRERDRTVARALTSTRQEVTGALRSDRQSPADRFVRRPLRRRAGRNMAGQLGGAGRAGLLEKVFYDRRNREEDGAFRVELREPVGRHGRGPVGIRFLRSCDADLGDARCKVNLANPNHSTGCERAPICANPDRACVADQLKAGYDDGLVSRRQASSSPPARQRRATAVEIGEHYAAKRLRNHASVETDAVCHCRGRRLTVTRRMRQELYDLPSQVRQRSELSRLSPHSRQRFLARLRARRFRTMDGGPIVP